MKSTKQAHRRVTVQAEGLLDPTMFTWLQYHHSCVLGYRNVLALQSSGSLLTYANLHFQQVTTLEQVEISPISSHQMLGMRAKVRGLAQKAKEERKMEKMARKPVVGLIEDFTKTSVSTKSIRDDEKGVRVMHLDNSVTSLLDVEEKAESKQQEESSGAVVEEEKGSSKDEQQQQQHGDEAKEEQEASTPVGADEEKKADPKEEGEGAKETEEKEAAAAAAAASVVAVADATDESVDSDTDDATLRDDDDDSASLRLAETLPNDVTGKDDPQRESPQSSPRSPRTDGSGVPSKAHVLDASLNRIRHLRLSQVTQWNVRSILLMNLSGNLLVSLEGIECCANLVALDCSDNILSYMHPLRECKSLKRLRINGNRLVSVSLDVDADAAAEGGGEEKSSAGGVGGVLLEYPQLEYLDLNDNKMDSERGLRGLEKFGRELVHLEMRKCNLSTSAFASLEACTKLESFHADNNHVTSLKELLPVLRSMKSLRHLSFLGNPIAGGVSEEEKDEGEDAKDGPKASLYAITIFDNVATLRTFDHLAVPPGIYNDLARLKTAILGEDILFEISNKYSREITTTMRVHENLVARHRLDEELLEFAVKTKAARLEQEMDEVLTFGREQIESLRPKFVASDHYAQPDPTEVLHSIQTLREKGTTPFRT